MSPTEPWRIQEGDTVDVVFENSVTIFGGRVRHIPQATGDCWVIEVNPGGSFNKHEVFYVQNFAYIRRQM